MRMNASMSRLLATTPADARVEDAPEAFRAIAAEGWIVDDNGAQLLKALRAGYSGADGVEGFQDIVHYEASINGRGMMDYDLPPSGPDRRALLVRRCLGYAHAALRTAPANLEWPVFGYVSLSSGGLHDDTLTAHVTFCSQRPGILPYADDMNSYIDEALLEISQKDASARAS